MSVRSEFLPGLRALSDPCDRPDQNSQPAATGEIRQCKIAEAAVGLCVGIWQDVTTRNRNSRCPVCAGNIQTCREVLTVICRRFVATFLATLLACVGVVHGQLRPESRVVRDVPAPSNPARCVIVELFVTKDCPFSRKARSDLEQRPGLDLRILDVTENKDALRRFYSLADQHHVTPRLPLVHACRQVVVGYDEPSTTGVRYDRLLTIEVFLRDGCAHCAAAKLFLKRIAPRYPGLRFTYGEIVTHADQRLRYEELCRKYGIRLPGVPAFHTGKELVVGYAGDATTGAKLLGLLDEMTVPCTVPHATQSRTEQPATSRPESDSSQIRGWRSSFSVAQAYGAESAGEPPQASPAPPRPDDPDLSSLPPARPETESGPTVSTATPPVDEELSEVEVPFFGTLDVKQLGMPLFTIILGLVDGFNPCAMWVLLFLLSILINLHDRRKILAVAGTFVVVSGLVYFAFMAAWLNVFRLIGFRRWSEVALAMIAIAFGAINIKDFLAFKRGVSLSIPESAKPGIYARVRAIVTAQHMTAAICGAIVLAVLVNFIELLCTAGLPALYTKVLAMQQYPMWLELSYLGLYNLAYMFDDGVMVAIAVVTLGRHKLQEREGRWLKLISGCTILVLGIILLFVPQWLSYF